jgi:hypothetical protein
MTPDNGVSENWQSLDASRRVGWARCFQAENEVHQLQRDKAILRDALLQLAGLVVARRYKDAQNYARRIHKSR